MGRPPLRLPQTLTPHEVLPDTRSRAHFIPPYPI